MKVQSFFVKFLCIIHLLTFRGHSEVQLSLFLRSYSPAIQANPNFDQSPTCPFGHPLSLRTLFSPVLLPI
jgi:hypothetical protein